MNPKLVCIWEAGKPSFPKFSRLVWNHLQYKSVSPSLLTFNGESGRVSFGFVASRSDTPLEHGWALQNGTPPGLANHILPLPLAPQSPMIRIWSYCHWLGGKHLLEAMLFTTMVRSLMHLLRVAANFHELTWIHPPKLQFSWETDDHPSRLAVAYAYFILFSDTFRCSRQILICPSFSAAEWNDAVPCPGGHLMHLYIAHEARQSVWPILSTGILKLGRMRTFAGVTIFIMRKQDGTIEYIDIINIIMIIITSQGKCRFVDSTVWLHPKKTAENPRLSSFSLAHRTSLSFSDLSWMPASALDPSSAKADCWWNWWPFGLK